MSFLFAIVISAIISWVFSHLTRRYFVSRGWVEDPILKQKKTGNATALFPVPRGGGIPIFLATTFTVIFFLPLDKHLIGIILAAFIALVIGVWDDLRDIRPAPRFFVNLLTGLVIVSSGIGIAYLSNPLGGIIDLSYPRLNINIFGPHSIWLISDLLAVIWIAWCSNIVGWSAGVEGQLPGYVAIAAIFIGILGLRYSADITQWPVIILAGAVAGAYLGFLPLNFHPQRMMPGYSGKSLAGFYLAVISILSGAKLATVILLLGIPTLDAIFVIARRLLHHQSIAQGGSHHLHHYLLRLGWTRPQIAFFYWAFSLVLGLISLFLNSRQKLYVFVGLFCLFLSVIIPIYRRTSPKSSH